MQIGLLGKTNVGKSTFFSAATETPVQVGNFPFTTIEPNVGIAYVQTECACKNFEINHENPLCVNGMRYVPIKLVDVAGLVPGAHEGKGLGNKFLDDARQAEALIHVVDIAGATDFQGQPVPVGTHDPLEDIKFVEEEFDQWFFQILKREWQNLTKEIEQKKTKIVEGISKRFSGLGIKDFEVHEVLQSMDLLNKKPAEWTDSEIQSLVKTLRKKTKPIVIAANKADLCKNLAIVEKIKNGNKIEACSAETELLLKKAAKAGVVKYSPGGEGFTINDEASMSAEQKKALELVKGVFSKIKTTGIQKILNTVIFDILKLIVVYPVEDETKLCNRDGQVLPDAQLLPFGSTAKDLAGTIHADLAKGFAHAIDVKTKQRIGHDHKLKNGDVIKIISTTSRG